MYFNVNFNVFFKLIKLHLLARKLYKNPQQFSKKTYFWISLVFLLLLGLSSFKNTNFINMVSMICYLFNRFKTCDEA